MLSFQTVIPDTLELLKKLMREDLLTNTRLVGGTALALQYGHRNSVDLDFFGNMPDNNLILRDMLSKYGNIEVRGESPNIKCYTMNGIRIDMVSYKYEWIDNMIEQDGLRLASPKDIAAMKINAIEGRGSKKDFIDIYFLLQHYSLKDIIGFYTKKYPEHSEFRALMSLTYFEDADLQLMPRMYKPVDWNEIKSYITIQVKNYNS